MDEIICEAICIVDCDWDIEPSYESMEELYADGMSATDLADEWKMENPISYSDYFGSGYLGEGVWLD